MPPPFSSLHISIFALSAKTFEHEWLKEMLAAIEPLLADADRYKQRAGAEVLAGLMRGTSHTSNLGHALIGH